VIVINSQGIAVVIAEIRRDSVEVKPRVMETLIIIEYGGEILDINE